MNRLKMILQEGVGNRQCRINDPAGLGGYCKCNEGNRDAVSGGKRYQYRQKAG